MQTSSFAAYLAACAPVATQNSKPNTQNSRLAACALFVLSFFGQSLSAQSNTGSPLGTANFAAFYTDAPTLPQTTSEAARRTYGADWRNPDIHALDNFYQPFADRLEHAVDEYKQYYSTRSTAYYETQNEETMRAQAMAQANQNPILASMGGAENVAKMTPQQAEVAARKAAAEYAADPFAANNIQSQGMTALYQKIAADPAYAARFQNMSEKEREAELRRYMANDKVQAKTPAQLQKDHARFEQQMQESDKIRASMMFQQYSADMTAKISAVQTRHGQQHAELLASPGNHADIEADFSKKYAAIPMVIMGEGREKEPVQTIKLYQETATRHREFAAKVLQQEAVLLGTLQNDYKRIAAEHIDFLKAHRHEVNGNIADQMTGTETESMLAGLEMGLLDLADDLAKKSKQSTKEAANWEKNWHERTGN